MIVLCRAILRLRPISCDPPACDPKDAACFIHAIPYPDEICFLRFPSLQHAFCFLSANNIKDGIALHWCRRASMGSTFIARRAGT